MKNIAFPAHSQPRTPVVREDRPKTLFMPPLPPELLGRACRVFMNLAYPHGPESIPARKRPYLDIADAETIAAFVPPAEGAIGVARELQDAKGEGQGFEFRLGSAVFPHLKLRVQTLHCPQGAAWVFMVDTHDHFPRVDHAVEEEAWRQLQQANRRLKEQIETALEEEGFTTPNKLLRAGLK